MNQQFFPIGSILYSSWGYEQTNIDFYQVIRHIGTASIELCEIAQIEVKNARGFCGETMPKPNQFLNQPFKKRINKDSQCIKINDCCHAYLWAGEALCYSTEA